MLTPGQSCRVINHEKQPLTIGWDNVDYVLMPNIESIVPAEAAICAFGDPQASAKVAHVKDLHGRDRWIGDRDTEIRRLNLLYGLDNGGHYPDVTVRTVTGEMVSTVVNDPAGKSVTPADVSMQQQQTLEEMVSKMQQELDALRAQAGIQGQIIAEDELPRDDDGDNISERQIVNPKAAYDERDDENGPGFSTGQYG